MKIKLLFFLVISINLTYANDLYWIGGSGEWNDTNHWSTTSGGSSCGEIPNTNDNVFFDSNSFSSNNSQINFNTVSVKSLHFSANETSVFTGTRLTISNYFNLISNTTFNSIIEFSSNDNDTHSINTGGFTQNSDFIIENGDWELENHLITSSDNSIVINCNNFNSNGKSIYTNSFLANSSNLTLSNSSIFTFDSFNTASATKTGSNPILFTNGSSTLNLGQYSGATTKDQSIVCSGGLTLDINITADYNGSNVSCNGVCDAEITATVSGTAGPFSYNINGGAFSSTFVFSGLCPNFYTIVVTDSSQVLAPGIFATCTSSPELISPAASITFNPINGAVPISPTCPGVCDGQAFTASSGGTGTLVVTWPVSGEITSNPVGLCGGNNAVVITDDNGCVINENVFVSPVQVIDFDVTITPPSCNGDADAEILISNETGGNGGPWTYVFNPIPGSGSATDNPAVGYNTGFVTVSVFDAGAGGGAPLCQQDSLVEIIDPTILTTTAINPTSVSCFGFCDGELTALPNGGVPPYTFEWFDNTTGLTTGFTDSIPSTFCTGDYYVVVTDAAGCTGQSLAFNIGTPTQIVTNSQAYPISCFGVCDGSVDVDPSGGTPGYTYSWTTFPGGAGVGATDSLSGLCPGFYQIIVTDANGCPATAEVLEVLDVLPMTLALASNDPACYDICDGDITAVAGGGVGGFTYAWLPAPITGQGTPNVTNLCGGITYDLTVTDANGCFLADNVTLSNPVVYDITTAETDLLCSGDCNGTASVAINSGGNGGPYTFVWAPGNPIGQGTNSVTNLCANNYSVTISDGVGCDTTIFFNITSPSPLSVNASVISHVLCSNACNGSAQVAISGGTTNYTILWDDPSNQNTNVASALCGGNYTVNVTDASGCTGSDNVTITEPAPYDVTVSQTDLNCFGDCDATATVTVNGGGSPAYTIVWDDPLNQNTFTAIGLCAGTYNATLSDANNCDTIITFTIIDPVELTLALSVDNSACFGSCSGQATIVPVGGTGLLTFEWFDAITNTPLGVNNTVISNLCPGDYYATATDANGCITTTNTFSITELAQITTSLISSTPASCGFCDAQAEVSASGGAGGFTFTWNPAPTISGQGTTTADGLCGGVYSVDIVDANGCVASQGVNINSVALEILNLDSVDVSCFGICDGEATINFVCLEPPCVVEWFDNTTGISTGQFGNNATNLCSGDYLALLTNNLGCVISDTITINTPPEIVASIATTDENCFNSCDGTATVTASGGEGNLSYTWNPLPGSGQGTINAGGLCLGNWDITVTDDSSCFVNIPFVIGGPTDIAVDNVSATDVSCFGVTDGTATIIASGGTNPLSYEWFICATNISVGNGAFINGLAPGDYYAVVTDGNGCTTSSTCVTVNDQNEITAIINSQNSSCFGDCNGMIDVAANGGNGIYFYQWQDDLQTAIAGQTNDTISNICQGTYYIEITDGNGCTLSQGPIDMTQPTNPWDVASSSTDISCNNVCDGTASVVVNAGNNPPYTYLWDDPANQITSTATSLCPGTYNVLISDAGVCDTTVQLTINDVPAFNNLGTQTDINCFGDCTGEAIVTPGGGTGPYTVTWSDAQIGVTASNLCVGPVIATITDATGCSMDTTFTIIEPGSSLTTNSVFVNNSTCGLCNGSATVNVIGGTPNYTYVWSGPFTGQGTNTVSDLCSGIISVDVTDANGCSVTETFALQDVNGEVLTINSTDVSCFGICDGTADVAFACSDPACVQEWYDATTGITTGITSTNINGLCAGDYYVQVVNASNCISIENVTIGSPTQIIPNETVTQITCTNDADATIVVVPFGGSGAGYTYDWNPVPGNGNGTDTATPVGPGIWTIVVTDGIGCKDSTDVNIIDPTPIVINTTLSDVACAGACNGSIITNVSGGYGNYTYQWFMNSVLMPGETNSNILALCPGNYNVEVTDQNGCVQTLTNDVTISEPFAINSPIISTDVVCNGQCDGIATITPTGGSGAYIINWYDGTNTLIGQSGLIATNLCPDDYYATVTDANNCTFTTAIVTISEPVALTFTTTSNDASCFGICDGDASITLNGGLIPYTYVWLDVLNNPIPGGTNSTVNNLCPDNYTVEGIDDNGCSTGPQNIIILGFTQITANLFANDADCGIQNGSASVFANGGNPPYTYQWLDNAQVPIAGETNTSILNIGSGTYYVDVIDANLCTQTFQIDVNDIPTTTMTWDLITHPTCFGANDGGIEATVVGLSMPLSFVWNPGGMITEDLSNLTSGNYTLQVTDALGCINFYDTTLVDPAEIIITPTTTDSDCNLCNGEISVILNGGTGVLTSSWNNGLTGTLIQNLCPSVYEITVTDGSGCTQVEQIPVNNTTGLTANVTVSAITCTDVCDGVITVDGVGGTAPYTYNWLNFTSTNNTEPNLCADIYFIEVTDDIGCITPVEVDLLNPTPFVVIENITPPDCGVNNGQISITSSGGNLPHTYLWNTTDVTPAISNLAAGVYTVTITDNSGCSQDFVYGLGNLVAPTVTLTPTDLTCNSVCNGQITSNVVGGTPIYTYQWMDVFGAVILTETNPDIINQCAGTYILEVTDDVGCVIYETADIIQPDTILLNTPFEVGPSCFGDCDGSITINPIGGTQPFTYLWDDPANQTVFNPSALCSGVYNATITDANGCIANQIATLIDPAELTIDLDSIVDATCVNSPDGAIYITIGGGTPPLSVQWTNNGKPDTLTTEDIIGVLPLIYYVEVTDINGCTALDTFAVDTLLTVLAYAGNDTILCYENDLLLNGTSNQADADYTWYDINGVEISDTSELIMPNQTPGTVDYVLMVSFSGCDHTDTISVTTQNEIIVDAGPDLEMLSIETDVIGGNPTNPTNTTVTWTPSIYLSDSTLANPNVIQPDEDIWYMVIVTDTIGCTGFDSVYIEVVPSLIIPDGISPNGDGKNETWVLGFKEDFPDIEISIYNRWGELLFYDNTGYLNEWYGKFNGEELPVGTYYYVIDVHHEFYPEPFTGPITIMR